MKFYPYAPEPLGTNGYSICKFKTPNKTGIRKCCVVNKDKAINILGLEIAKYF